MDEKEERELKQSLQSCRDSYRECVRLEDNLIKKQIAMKGDAIKAAEMDHLIDYDVLKVQFLNFEIPVHNFILIARLFNSIDELEIEKHKIFERKRLIKNNIDSILESYKIIKR
jgi:hypothetical protein